MEGFGGDVARTSAIDHPMSPDSRSLLTGRNVTLLASPISMPGLFSNHLVRGSSEDIDWRKVRTE